MSRGWEVLKGICLYLCDECQVENTCSSRVGALEGMLAAEELAGVSCHIPPLRDLGGLGFDYEVLCC